MCWSVLSDKEGELGNNKAFATGVDNCITFVVPKKTKPFVSIRLYHNDQIIPHCEGLVSQHVTFVTPTGSPELHHTP